MESYHSNRTCRCTRCRCRGLMAPAVMVLLGLLFLLDNFGVMGFHRSWPLLLIAIGAVLVLQRSAPMDHHVSANLPPNWTDPEGAGKNQSEAHNG